MGKPPARIPRLQVLAVSAVVLTVMGMILVGVGARRATSSISDPVVDIELPKHREAVTEKVFIGICLSVKDDARWLREWLDFHKAVGIGRIYVMDDGSSDTTLQLLETYSKQNDSFVEIIPGGVPFGDSRCQKPQARDSAYISKCIDHVRHKVDWLLLIDSDEYIFPREGCSLPEYFKNCNQKATHYLLDWEMFGSSHALLHPPGHLTENFLLSGGDCSQYVDTWGTTCQPFNGHCKECRHTKYIANMNCMPSAEHCANHFPSRLELALSNCSNMQPESEVNDDCKLWYYGEKKYQPKKCCKAGIALHHYAPKSQEARRWRSNRKMRNGLHNDRNQTPQMDKRDLNWVYSPGILKYVKRLRSTVATNPSPFVEVESISMGNKLQFDCFIERHFKYSPRPGTDLFEVQQLVDTPSACCLMCYQNATCRAFTHRPSHESCSLFVASSHNWPPHSIPLDRNSVDGYISGTPIREGSC
eukprot:TRINITY_DN30411_c0_g1_i1.p1 TRINITY_DN30411_c0_g1~~TRINITY_DN30411_c0_g1_i1.p1  ORF type:complete len:474 (+),score=45.91 TRINITY_DN30411_c0_g1_i1:66-1487(+)